MDATTSKPAAPTKLYPWDCPVCSGRGFFVKAPTIFVGRTYRVNCGACRGTGAAPAPTVIRKAAA